jgi:Bardet-Biedl syndrome 2 protein
VVKAEDCRLQGNLAAMRKQYRALRNLNRDLLVGHAHRMAKDVELADHLKCIGRTIHAAGRLRLGRAREQLVAGCRSAVQKGDVAAFQRVLREGT